MLQTRLQRWESKAEWALAGCAVAFLVIYSYEVLAATPRPRELYVLWHMNAAGNALIARLVADALGLKGY